MTHYVVGLLFDEDKEYVVLIRKKKGPSALIGKWNGVGGKVECHESSHEAMTREFKEETGVSIPLWHNFMTLSGNGWAVDFYHCFNSWAVGKVTTQEEEVVSTFPLETLSEVVPNLRWIIPMALGHRDDHVNRYGVVEVETL